MDVVTLALARKYTDLLFSKVDSIPISDISLVDDTTGTKYTLGINNGVLYIKEVTG